MLTCLVGMNVATTASASNASDEQTMFDLTNQARLEAGLAPLVSDPAVANVARVWAGVLATTQVLAHNSQFVAQIGALVPGWQRIGENVGYAGSPQSVQSGFMGSAGHRANVLGDYNRVGIGVVRDLNGRMWVAVNFVKGPALAPPPTSGLNLELARPSAVAQSTTRVDAARRAGDGSVEVTTWTGTTWTGWTSIGGYTLSDPEAVSWGAGRLDVFAVGGDRALWHRGWTTGSGWMPWERLGGELSTSPGAAAWSPGRVDVFAGGLDGALWTISWTGSGWTDWTSLGGTLTSRPDVASWGAGRLDVFARGTDSALWHRAFGAGTWFGWERIGGALGSGPGAVSWGPGRIDVVAAGTDGALWLTSWSGAWTGWSRIGGALGSSPDAASRGSGLLDVIAAGTDGAPYVLSWTGQRWSGWSRIL